MLKLILVWVLAAFFTLNSLYATFRSNGTVGTIMVWCLSAMFILYGIFHRQVDVFCSHGMGRVLKYAVWAGGAFFVGMFVFVAASGYSGSAKGDEKAIIVLGAGLRGQRVSDVLRRRLAAALEAWQENPAAYLVVTGGQGPGEAIPEALAMQRWLLDNGVPQEHIVVEDKSVSTEENLLFAKALLAKKGISDTDSLAIVSNAFHCSRAGQYAKKLGFTNVRTVPASMNPGTLMPSYLREILAIVYMWLFRRNLSA